MDPFYYIVSGVTVILLILLLSLVGVMMSKPNNSELYPPTKLQCPDYWTFANGSCTPPNNNVNQPSKTYVSVPGSSGNSVNFGDSQWNNNICQYKKWANEYGVNWDGVSNYNGC